MNAQYESNGLPAFDANLIRQHAEFLLQGEFGCLELRVIGDKSNPVRALRFTESGFYNDVDSLIRDAIANHNKRAVCIGLNPRQKELLHAQPANRLCGGEGGKNEDIVCRRVFGIDIDTRRANRRVAASAQELEEALPVFEAVKEDLSRRGISPISAMSGNGRHLNILTMPYEITKETDGKDGSFALLLRYFQRIFGNDKAEIDCGVFDPARIWKLYGTSSLKGGNTVERPWRTAQCKIPALYPDPVDLLFLYKAEIADQKNFESKSLRLSGRTHLSVARTGVDIVELFRSRE